ncbi:3'-5' exonuclease [Oceanobacter mangrovi]|uniref:3'-5' exonuclease n=1 Tax=Oceanobacter mangrovi TaxID=2862510 RepID=UPI001FE8375E|nr:3'-5' exonuclease [Oceanobacter mangrovi]
MSRFQQRLMANLSPSGRLSWPELYAAQARNSRHPALRDFYAAGVPDPGTPLAEVPLVAIDFETTGLDAKTCDIVSIGLVPMTIKRIYSSQARHWIVRPRTDLSTDSVVVHGITHSDVDAAPDLSQQLDEVLEQLKGKVVVAHCCAIERNFLDKAVRARWGDGIRFPMLDTMQLEADLVRQPTLIERVFGAHKKSLRLGDARERYGLPFYHPHHAQTDALACAELLQAQIASHCSPTVSIASLWC